LNTDSIGKKLGKIPAIRVPFFKLRRSGIFVEIEIKKIQSPVRGGIFRKFFGGGLQMNGLQNMSLLRSLKIFFGWFLQRCRAYGAGESKSP